MQLRSFCRCVVVLASVVQWYNTSGDIQRTSFAMSQVAEGGGQAGAQGHEPPAKVAGLRQALELEIALQDPYCGEIAVRNITKPFVQPDEISEISSWEL